MTIQKQKPKNGPDYDVVKKIQYGEKNGMQMILKN